MGWDTEDIEDFESESGREGRILNAISALDDRVYGLIERARYYGDPVTREHLEEILVELRRIREIV